MISNRELHDCVCSLIPIVRMMADESGDQDLILAAALVASQLNQSPEQKRIEGMLGFGQKLNALTVDVIASAREGLAAAFPPAPWLHDFTCNAGHRWTALWDERSGCPSCPVCRQQEQQP